MTENEVRAGQLFRSLDPRDYAVDENRRLVPRDLRVVRVGHDGGAVVENVRTGRRSRIHGSRLATGHLFAKISEGRRSRQ